MRAPRVVVGYDGSAASRAAVAWAARRAGRRGHLVIVHADSGPGDEPAGQAVLDDLLLEADGELLDTDFSLVLATGEPARVLVDTARAGEADEIVVGSRGFGALRGALGSVSHELVHLADRPLVVVPDPADG